MISALILCANQIDSLDDFVRAITVYTPTLPIGSWIL
jgi:hypothetical protein